MDPTNRRTCPERCVNQPVSGIETALAAAKIVMTHVPSSTVTPRLPEIVGIATLAIDKPGADMNVASATTMVAITSLPPVSGWYPVDGSGEAGELEFRFIDYCVGSDVENETAALGKRGSGMQRNL
jgi:hypothetical protein